MGSVGHGGYPLGELSVFRLNPFDPQQHLLEVVEEWAQKQPNKEALVDAYESGLDCWGIAGGPLKFGVGSDSPVTNETFVK